MIIDTNYGATFYREGKALVFSPDYASEWGAKIYVWGRNSVYYQPKLQGEVRLI